MIFESLASHKKNNIYISYILSTIFVSFRIQFKTRSAQIKRKIAHHPSVFLRVVFSRVIFICKTPPSAVAHENTDNSMVSHAIIYARNLTHAPFKCPAAAACTIENIKKLNIIARNITCGRQSYTTQRFTKKNLLKISRLLTIFLRGKIHLFPGQRRSPCVQCRSIINNLHSTCTKPLKQQTLPR